jgi:hypothetical protein
VPGAGVTERLKNVRPYEVMICMIPGEARSNGYNSILMIDGLYSPETVQHVTIIGTLCYSGA